MANKNLTEVQLIEKYRISLENVETQPVIAKAMEELGFDTAEIAKGKLLLGETASIYNLNKQEFDEKSAAYSNYIAQRKVVSDIYGLHRKKAKVVFRNDLEILKQLELEKALSQGYAKWLEGVKKFYSEIINDETLQTKLLRLKVTKEDLNNAGKEILKLDKARAEYIREKGESQEATQDKNAAFDKMEDWMYEFYAVAKIALEDNAQLLESLGVLVRS